MLGGGVYDHRVPSVTSSKYHYSKPESVHHHQIVRGVALGVYALMGLRFNLENPFCGFLFGCHSR